MTVPLLLFSVSSLSSSYPPYSSFLSWQSENNDSPPPPFSHARREGGGRGGKDVDFSELSFRHHHTTRQFMCVFELGGRGSKFGLRLTDGAPGQFGPGKRRRGESKRSTSSSRERSAVYYVYSTAMELPPIFALGGRLLLNEKVVSCQINSIHTQYGVWY